jgi:hypothetical protein
VDSAGAEGNSVVEVDIHIAVVHIAAVVRIVAVAVPYCWLYGCCCPLLRRGLGLCGLATGVVYDPFLLWVPTLYSSLSLVDASYQSNLVIITINFCKL